MINVLFVIDRLIRGGVTNFFLNYFRHIDHEKIHIDVLGFSEVDHEIERELCSKGVEIYLIEIDKITLSTPGYVYREVKNFFSRNSGKYDIVHSNFYQLDFLIFYFAKKNHVQKCISHAHSTSWSENKFKAIRNRIMGFPVPYCADIWAACSMDGGRFLYGKQFLYSPKKKIIPNAIEIKRFSYNESVRAEVRREFGYNDEIVLGHVGRLHPIKNQMFLIKIMQSLIAGGDKQYRMLIVGDGELRDSLKMMAKQLGIEDYVKFTGHRSDVGRMLQGMDVFLLPSLSEGFPFVSIEAQTAGLPCFLSEGVPRDADIINVQHLTIHEGVDAWVQAIKSIQPDVFRMRSSKELEIAKAGYDITQEASKLGEFYQSLVEP